MAKPAHFIIYLPTTVANDSAAGRGEIVSSAFVLFWVSLDSVCVSGLGRTVVEFAPQGK